MPAAGNGLRGEIDDDVEKVMVAQETKPGVRDATPSSVMSGLVPDICYGDDIPQGRRGRFRGNSRKAGPPLPAARLGWVSNNRKSSRYQGQALT